MIVGSANRQFRRADGHRHHQGVGIAARGPGEAMDVVEVGAGLAGFEALVGAQRHVHGVRRVARTHAAQTPHRP
ncbi:hypothetical protein D3C86_1302490 [compost metagenome]